MPESLPFATFPSTKTTCVETAGRCPWLFSGGIGDTTLDQNISDDTIASLMCFHINLLLSAGVVPQEPGWRTCAANHVLKAGKFPHDAKTHLASFSLCQRSIPGNDFEASGHSQMQCNA